MSDIELEEIKRYILSIPKFNLEESILGDY
jgi:hypothetical protein